MSSISAFGFRGVQGLVGIQSTPTMGRQGLQGLQGFQGVGTQGTQGIQGIVGGSTGYFYQSSFGSTGIDVTNVPSNWKVIQGTINYNNGTQGSGQLALQIGDSTTWVTSGYYGAGARFTTTGTNLQSTNSVAFNLDNTQASTSNNLPCNFMIVSQDNGTTANLLFNNTSFGGSMIWAVGYNLVPLSSVMTRFRLIYLIGGVPSAVFSGDTSMRVWYI